MPLGLESFLKTYSSAIQEGAAALFIGSGMSRKKGCVKWEELLGPYARQMGLDAEKEHDLVAVAQYYLNSKNRERSFLNQALIDEFDKAARPALPSHRTIARLRISTIWTTNYDRLIEEAFSEANRKLDVKLRDKDIGVSRKACKAVLYKMHGDISQPDKIIISKEDYERYPRTHPIFQNTLTTDLLRKTFLFLGFGFADPNLDYTLGHLCSLLENEKRAHYAIMRYARRDYDRNEDGSIKYESDGSIKYKETIAEFEYKTRKQVLQIDDLQRYGIETVLIDYWDQVEEILEVLKKMINCREVETQVLNSERAAIEFFYSLKVSDIFEKLKNDPNLKRDYPSVSDEKLKDIVLGVAKDITERETKINVDHIDMPIRVNWDANQD
jgi:hypothetical protein